MRPPAQNQPSPQKKQRPSPKRITPDYLHNAGLYYLERFAASSAHFRSVMTRKIDRSCRAHTDQSREACLTMLEGVIERFTESGLLNDQTYGATMVASLRRRGLGTRAIGARLQSKGLGPDLIAATLNAHDEEENDGDLAAALRLARRKKIGPFRALPYPPDEQGQKEKTRDMGRLARAGFGYHIARTVLDISATDAENGTIPP